MDDTELEINQSEVNYESSGDEIQKKKVRPKRLLHVTPTKEFRCSSQSGFQKSAKLCLKFIRDAMLHHRWEEAAQYLAAFCQTLEGTAYILKPVACEIIWRLTTEVLRHHPNTRLEDLNALYERMKNTGVKYYAKIALEHAFHLLLNGHVDDAKRQLSVAASWRYGKQSAKQALDLKLIQAYCGFLDYFIWCKKKSSLSSAEDNSSNREMHSYFRQASVTLQEIISQPGVWDPFVLSYVDMLEFYDDEEGAQTLLENYAYDKDYPSNPNAHVYLYQFLKRHDAPPAKLISALKVLHSLVPSHELMLEYCSLLLNSDEEENHQKSLNIAFNLLDYPSWKYDLNAWNLLLKIMTVLKENGLKAHIEKEWSTRRDLWLAMHYRNFHGKKDAEENPELLQVKSKVAKLLGEHKRGYNKFNSQVWGRFNQEKKKMIRKRQTENLNGNEKKKRKRK